MTVYPRLVLLQLYEIPWNLQLSAMKLIAVAQNDSVFAEISSGPITYSWTSDFQKIQVSNWISLGAAFAMTKAATRPSLPILQTILWSL